MKKEVTELLNTYDTFNERHLGLNEHDLKQMLSQIGASSVEDLMTQAVPSNIYNNQDIELAKSCTETQSLAKKIAAKNKIYKSFIGLGYYGNITPPVILRNLLENPSWYTPYTPYQAEIAQGRLELPPYLSTSSNRFN